MNFQPDDTSLPQIGDAVTAAVEQAESHLEEDDREHARAALQEAEGLASTSDEYGAIAGVILSELCDEEWGRKVLAEAVDRATTATGLATLAGYALQISDVDLTRTIIGGAEAKATSSVDAVGAVAIAKVFGGDPDLSEALHRKAEALASTEGGQHGN